MEGYLIYVAGNPNNYPIEYFDPQSKGYKGLIPALLERFARENGYTIRYYQPGVKDQRANLAAHRQVDLITGSSREAFSHTAGELLGVLSVQQGEEAVTYGLWCSDVAPGPLQAQLQSFLGGLSQPEQTRILLEEVKSFSPQREITLTASAAGLALGMALLLATLLLLARRYRCRIRRLQRSCESDEETGLGNVWWLRRQYAAVINDRTRPLYCLCGFYLDRELLERRHGREKARALLRRGAAALRESAAATDRLARASDGGFVLLRLLQNSESGERWLADVRERLCRRLEAESGAAVRVAASLCPLQAGDEELDGPLSRVMQGAQEAYRDNREVLLCSPEWERQLREERQLWAEIRQGWEQGEFLLYLQFYVHAQTLQAVGAEALVRWNHPEKGFLTPSHFIPIMEREGMISRLDYGMLKRVCLFLEELWERGEEGCFISCNFSGETFAAADFVAQCREILEGFHFSRELLIFEVTQNAPGWNAAQARRNAAQLQELGIRMALDDFGEGYAALYELQDFPADGIKLGKNLVERVGSQEGERFLRALVQMGHALGLTVQAKGVETAEQAHALQQMGCDVLQGYYFSYPVPDWDADRQMGGWASSRQAETEVTL